MRSPLRGIVGAAAAALLVAGFGTSAAYASPPSNDTAAGATDVGSLPFSLDEDTTQATTDALDATLNDQCGAPATNASVWFKYTETTGDGFVASVSDSDYSAGLLVTEGDPSLGQVITCGPGAVGVQTTPGTTYYVLAFSDTSTIGGNLHITFDTAPPPPELTVVAGARGTVNKDGSATIGGTYSCTNADGDNSEIDGTLTQRVGRLKLSGDFSVYPLTCDGASHRWSARVTAYNGLFKGGKAASVSFGFACGLLTCADGYAEQTIQLSGTTKK